MNRKSLATPPVHLTVVELLFCGRHVDDMQSIRLRVDRGHQLHVLPFIRSYFALIVNLVRSLGGGILEHQLVSGFRDLSLKALSGLTLFGVSLLLGRLLLSGACIARALLILLSEKLDAEAAQAQD